MREATFDKDGYPTEETLQEIRDWPHTDFKGLIEFVGEAWRYPEYWRVMDYADLSVEASTGGWSGNESLISALYDNVMFWAMCWMSSKRGGHYVFKIPTSRRSDENSMQDRIAQMDVL